MNYYNPIPYGLIQGKNIVYHSVASLRNDDLGNGWAFNLIIAFLTPNALNKAFSCFRLRWKLEKRKNRIVVRYEASAIAEKEAEDTFVEKFEYQAEQFGVGFYSAFLGAEKVVVSTKSPKSDKQYVWEVVAGSSSYVNREETDLENLLVRVRWQVRILRSHQNSEFGEELFPVPPAHLNSESFNNMGALGDSGDFVA
ncbi:hypothetical protein CXB51_004987 [Gossypium anomalum]|uniref:Uncharacterized protein n=1 Tax=Gossypium anomalum TaxID=47600 RepID=A0A8J5Z0I5_9ROSI|nr:hypothetical protein CXB51_004987 [Gossypium anomalum]